MRNIGYNQHHTRPGSNLLYPQLWKGCVGAWCPSLGVTGNTLFDHSGFGNHGTLTNGPMWDVSEGRYANGFDGVNDWIDLGNLLIGSADFTVTVWIFCLARYAGGPPGKDNAFWRPLHDF